MAQLECFSSLDIRHSVGSLMPGMALGPCFGWTREVDEESGLVYGRMEAYGPFTNLQGYLSHHRRRMSSTEPAEIGADLLLDRLLHAVFTMAGMKATNVLTLSVWPPHILVDDDGNMVALLDYCKAMVLPVVIGYTQPPSWTTEDWINNNTFDDMPRDSFGTPRELRGYRELYAEYFKQAVTANNPDCDDWKYTNKAHLYNMILQAAVDEQEHVQVVATLVAGALKLAGHWGTLQEAESIMHRIGVDVRDGTHDVTSAEYEMLHKGFSQLLDPLMRDPIMGELINIDD